MYKPAVESIKAMLPVLYPNIETNFDLTDKNYEKFEDDSILIWVGERDPFENFFIKKIYKIHFHLERFTIKSDCQEIWTYSLYLYNLFMMSNNQIIKFIPVVSEEYVPKTMYCLNNIDRDYLWFLGVTLFNRHKKLEIMELSGLKIKSINNLWNDKDYNNFISDKSRIYLNITKDENEVLPSLRINKLLSHKCIVISEKTNPVDEELYEGMVFFKEIAEIGDCFKKLVSMSDKELEDLSENIYQKFISKFDKNNAPKLIKTYKPEIRVIV
jgi:hypothetical protein